MSAAPVNERLAALTAAGTSVWLDQIRRGMIESGELARMVAEDSLRGVTSNPAIFEKAILGSSDYDADIAAAPGTGCRRARSTAAWPCATCRWRPMCCAPSTTRRAATTATSRSRWRRGSRTTRTGRSSRRACTGASSTGPT
jgi:hypothetical protein